MGFHHMCVWTHDIDADTAYFESLGYPAATMGRSGSRFAYYDTRPLLGCMLEVVEHSERIEAMFNAVAAASVDWDGTDPIRPISEVRR